MYVRPKEVIIEDTDVMSCKYMEKKSICYAMRCDAMPCYVNVMRYDVYRIRPLLNTLSLSASVDLRISVEVTKLRNKSLQ